MQLPLQLQVGRESENPPLGWSWRAPVGIRAPWAVGFVHNGLTTRTRPGPPFSTPGVESLKPAAPGVTITHTSHTHDGLRSHPQGKPWGSVVEIACFCLIGRRGPLPASARLLLSFAAVEPPLRAFSHRGAAPCQTPTAGVRDGTSRSVETLGPGTSWLSSPDAPPAFRGSLSLPTMLLARRRAGLVNGSRYGCLPRFYWLGRDAAGRRLRC